MPCAPRPDKILLAKSNRVCYNFKGIRCRCSSMAECQLPKLNTRVRFPSPAPNVNDPIRFELIVVNCSDQVGSFSPVTLAIQGLQAYPRLRGENIMPSLTSRSWQAGEVGILTFHCSDNFGAMLQAYGLKQYLRANGEIGRASCRERVSKSV